MTNKPKCSIKGCKAKGTAFINKKRYCQYHFQQERSRKEGISPEKLPKWLTEHLNKAKQKTSQNASNHQFRAPYWEDQARKTEDEYLKKEEIKFGAREV